MANTKILFATGVAFCLLALANGIALYYHQHNSDLWLPRTEVGKWRLGDVDAMIKQERERNARMKGFNNFASLPPAARRDVREKVAEQHSSSSIQRIEARNTFRSYLKALGMWQWPLTLIATLLGLACVMCCDPKRRRRSAALILVSTTLLIDATYRSYYGALGW